MNCGWLRRAFFKTCPPAACTIARPDLPARVGTHVDLRSTSIRGGASAPYLPGCARQLLNVRCAHYAGGASLSTFGFVTMFLVTCQRQVIPSHSFAALAALIVRRVNGFANQPMPVCISRRATPKGVERVPGSGTLPPFAALTALVVRREVGWKPTFALHVPAAARPRRA